MKQVEVLEALELAASSQWGIITTSQAQREGISRLQIGRLADKGVLTRVQRGIYLLPSAQYSSLTDIRVAWVSLGSSQFPEERWENEDKIIVSHESAALVHQIGELIPQKMTFSSTARKQTSQDDIYIYINREISPQEISNVDGIPVTSVELTVADLAKKKIEFSYLASVVVDALRKENVRLKNIAQKLDDSSPAYGFSSGRQLVLACQEVAEADDDREEKTERFLDIWNGHLLPSSVYLGAASHTSQMNKILENLGAMRYTNPMEKLINNLGAASHTSQMDKILENLGKTNAKKQNDSLDNADERHSGHSLPATSNKAQEQIEIADSDNKKQETHE